MKKEKSIVLTKGLIHMSVELLVIKQGGLQTEVALMCCKQTKT